VSAKIRQKEQNAKTKPPFFRHQHFRSTYGILVFYFFKNYALNFSPLKASYQANNSFFINSFNYSTILTNTNR